MSQSNREIYRQIRSTAIERYESGRWDRDAAVDLLRHAYMSYRVEAPREQIVRGYRDHTNIAYCPFCGSESAEFIGWLPRDDESGAEPERRFECDCCGGFSIEGEIVGSEATIALPRVLCESPDQWSWR